MTRSEARPAEYQVTAAESATCVRIAAKLAVWGSVHRRVYAWRTSRDEYTVVLAEMLLQRTRADVVAAFLPAFAERYGDWAALRSAEITELERALQPLGLQRRRARALKNLADVWGTGRPSLPGIGQYIGRAIAVMLRGERWAMVDSNYVRVLRRIFAPPWGSDYRYDDRLQALARLIVAESPDPKEANLTVLDFGALVCTPIQPSCPTCPLLSLCSWGQSSGGSAS